MTAQLIISLSSFRKMGGNVFLLVSGSDDADVSVTYQSKSENSLRRQVTYRQTVS